MNRATMQKVMYEVFNECDALRQAGQQEYAHDEGNAFANFERVGEQLLLDRKQVLLVYAQKHYDGVASFVAGHTSQREDVRGRINDLIVYLCLLRGMIEEEQHVAMMESAAIARQAVQTQAPPATTEPEVAPFIATPQDFGPRRV